MDSKSSFFTDLFGSIGKLALQAISNQDTATYNRLRLEVAKLSGDTASTTADFAVGAAQAQSEQALKEAQLKAAQMKQTYILAGVVIVVIGLGIVLFIVSRKSPRQP